MEGKPEGHLGVCGRVGELKLTIFSFFFYSCNSPLENDTYARVLSH